jgi:hypothetical protein
MNTSILKILVQGRRRAQVIGQILCLTVVAAIFLVNSLDVLAGCGQNNAQQQAQQAIKKSTNTTLAKSIKLMAIIKQVDPSPATNALNASTLTTDKIPTGATLDGSVVLTPYTGQNLKVGDWIMIQQTTPTGSIAYAATIFGIKNGVAELWPAEKPTGANATLIPVGQKIFVQLNSLTSGTVTTTQPGN